MSTQDPTTNPDSHTIEVLADEANETVTFASSPRGESTLSQTEWITVAREDLVSAEHV